jgi:2-polyprenyl-3-methyl-5-hydroxy-6-metoxy-1,4-benzoquinol methylase
MVLKENESTSVPYAPSIEEQKAYWDARWEKNWAPNDWQRKRGETILSILRTLDLHRPRILDLGCATGWFTERLSHIGTVVGIDLSEKAVSIAKKNYPQIEFLAGNIFENPAVESNYDVVVTQEVVAHVEDQNEFIERIAAILKPGGYLVITSANKIVMERMSIEQDPEEHIKQWLGMKDLKKLLRPYFKIRYSTSIIPLGDQGFLRIINSDKLNRVMGWFIPRKYLEEFKERAGLGYSLIVLAQRSGKRMKE